MQTPDDIAAALTPARESDLTDRGGDPIKWADPSGDLETDSANEVAALSDYLHRRKKEDKRFADATDTEFWFAVHFPTREHKDAFLDALDVKLGDKYIGGLDLADHLGLDITWPT